MIKFNKACTPFFKPNTGALFSKNFGSFKVLVAMMLLILSTQFSWAQTSGDYRTNGAVTFTSATNWQKYNGSTWATVTAAPTSADGVISILNGHTATLNSAVTIDQVVVKSGGILTHTGNSFTVNNGAGNDIIIENGGFFSTNLPNTTAPNALPTFSTSATMEVQSGGIIDAVTTSGPAANYASDVSTFTNSVIWNDGSIFRWSNTSAPAASGRIFFPNASASTAPILRVSAAWGIPGGSGATTINGIIDVRTSFTWNGTGVKTFRNGITGTATMTQGSTGAWVISGSTADFGGTSGSLTLSLGSFGLAINSGVTATLSSNVAISAGTLTESGTLNCGTNAVTGAGTFTLASAATLGIGSTAGITSSGATGNIQTTTRNFNTAANYTYNGSANQATGTGLPATVNNLTIANTNGVASTGVSLSAAATTLNGVLTLTSGVLTSTASNTLTLANTAVGAVSGGSTTAFVNGPLNRTLPASLAASANVYAYPVGKGGVYYPASISTVTSGVTTPVVRFESFAASTGGSAGTGLSAISTTEYWQGTAVSGNFTSGSVSLTRQAALSALDAIGQNTSTLAGSYTSINGTAASPSVNSSDVVSNLGFFVLATKVSASALTPPSFTAASSPTVDASFNVTFTDDATWRNAITSVKYGANTLIASTDYSIAAGSLTLIPSGSVGSGLRTPGTATVTVVATGYNNATVSQAIGVGSANSITIGTQPTSPATSGAVLAAQPVMTVKDQYANVISGASVTAAVTSGQTSSWTLGGTTSVTANSSGVATFSGLTATNNTSPSAPNTSSITFTTGSATVTSNTFIVPGVTPVITAAVGATVDASFSMTFTDNSSWRTAITGITVGGSALSVSAYDKTQTGLIEFTPSASSLLQSNGTKSIVISATNYPNVTVSQAIGVGVANKLAMSVQPTAPASNGAVLAIQPKVLIQDQYGNTTTSTASVTATVGAGTWTIGGTTSVAAVSGLTTFSGLTATSAAAVSSATVTFTSGALTSVTSNTFNIVAPAPTNDLCNNAQTSTQDGSSMSGSMVGSTVSFSTSAIGDVWYKFVATCTGNITISSVNNGMDLNLYVFSAGCPSVSSGYDNCGCVSTSSTSETLTTAVTSGNTYYLRIAYFSGTASSFTFTVTSPVQVNQAVTTSVASSITALAAVLNGNVTAVGNCPPSTEKGFVYAPTSTNANPTVVAGVTKTPVSGIATGAYNLSLGSLTPGTDYSYNTYVYDGTTYAYGTAASFSTLSNPNLTVSGTTSHGSVCPNSSTSSITYTINNSGAEASNVVVSSSDAQFAVSNLSSTTIAASGSATYNVVFTPTTSGAKSATITVSYNTSTSATTSSISGTGTALVTGVVMTNAANSIVNTTATLNGSITTLGVCPSTSEKGFVYSATGTNADPLVGGTGVTKTAVSGLSTGSFTLALTGLIPVTSYTVKSYIYNGSSYIYGSAQTFSTLSVATKLGFGTAPSSTAYLNTNMSSFTVRALRSDDTVDPEYSGTVTLTSTGTVTGLTSTLVNGEAAFSATQFITNTGVYTLTATLSPLTSATSSSISVINAPVTLATYTFTGTACSSAALTASGVGSNYTVANASVSGKTCNNNSSVSYSVGGSSWGSAFSSSNYIEVSITPNSNYLISLTNLSFAYLRTGAGATALNVRSSLDSYVADLTSNISVGTSSSNASISLSGFNSQTSTVTFRIYGWGGNSTGDLRLDNIVITGAVSCTTPAQPSTITGSTTVCANSSQSYSVTNVSGTGYTWSLPSNITGSSTSNSISTSIGSAGNGTITVTPYNAASGCSSYTGTSRSLDLTVNSLPSTPTAAGSSRCGIGTVTISATPGTNETIDWYAAASGGTVLASGTSTLSFTTPSISSTTIYYAEARNLTTGCTSATRSAVTATINVLPSNPSANNASRCDDGIVTISATPGTGETIDWYSASTGGTLLSTGASSFTTPFISATTYYYAEARNTTSSCTAASRVTVTATVNAIPTPPNASLSQIFCAGATISSLATTSGSNIQWYANSSGGSPLLSSSSLVDNTHYFATRTVNGCESTSRTDVTATVNANNTSSVASSTPTLCINTALTAINHSTTGATGIGTATGLPAGVSAAWATNTITISGTPTASGTFNYSIPLTGGCGSVNATGSITVTPENTVGTASSTPTLCLNTLLTDVTHTTTGATGIGTATNLPAGVSAAWLNGTITISGTPTASGTFNYSIPLTGGCGSVNASGTITVTPSNTVGTASSTPTLCISTSLTAITHTTTGATGIGTATGLPAGVSASWSAGTITISGTPTASGTFNYSIPLTGGCGSVNATGAITVTANNTVGIASSTQTLFENTQLTDITHTTTGTTGIGTATGLPNGVTASWNSNTISISGTPTVLGTFAYSIPLTGGCGSMSATGTITVVNAYTWTGAYSTSWSDATNWIPNGVPTAADNVNIPAVASPNNQLEVLSSLTINSNVTFTLKSNAKLTLSGIITNNGTLTIENGATLVQTGTGNNSGNGTYNVKQDITGSSTTSGTISPNGRFWYLGAALSDASSTALLSNNNQLWQWNEGSFSYSPVTSGNLTQGKSYVLRSGQPTETINFSGASLSNGTVNVTGLTRSGTTQTYRGCHLISNPYPSYLDWNSITKTNIGTTMYIRTAIGTTLDVMETFNTVNNLATTISSVPLTQYIAPMQGFWVKVTTDNQTGSLTMDNSMRSHQPTGSGLRSTAQDFPAFLRFNMLDGQNKDQVILLMSPDATMSLDNFDSEKMSASGYAQFYSTVNATKLVINGMKNVKAKTSVPLTLVMPTSKSYTFQAEEFNIEDGLILLEDKQEGVIQDLTINPTYSFFGNAGTNATRFVVHFQLASAPVLVGGPQELESLGSDELMSDNIQIVSNNQGTVIIRLDEGFKPEGSIRIFDASGRLVEQTDFNDQETTIHLNEQAGMYFVEVSAGKLMVKKKIVIN